MGRLTYVKRLGAMRQDLREHQATLASAQASLRETLAARDDLQSIVQQSIARLQESEALLATPIYEPLWTGRRSRPS